MGGGRLPLVLLTVLAVGLMVGLGTAVGMVLAAPSHNPTQVSSPRLVARAGPAPPRDLPCGGATLAERAAQVLVVGLPSVTQADDPLVEELADVGVGGVFLTQTNIDTTWQVRRLVGQLRRGSVHPLLVTADEEPGRVSTLRALIGSTPSARRLAREQSPAGTRRFARDLGEAMAGLGIDVNLAPVVDVDAGPAGGVIGDRAFSGDPDVAAEHGLAFSAGLVDAGVRPAAKHFPGHGRTTTDSHDRLALVDATMRDLRASDLVPFAAQIDAGVPVVMVGHVAYSALDPDLPASLAEETYTLLRRMGFDGVAITDSLGMGAVHRRWDFPASAVMAVAAGADAVLATDGWRARAMRDSLVAAVRSGKLDADRLDEAAGRMLALKGVDPSTVVCRGVEPAPSFDGWAGGAPWTERRPDPQAAQR